MNDPDKNEWKFEVQNGDTVLGYDEWLEHKNEEAGIPSLRKRCEWAQKALDAHEGEIVDLIADLLHLAEFEGEDIAELMNRAQGHYTVEALKATNKQI